MTDSIPIARGKAVKLPSIETASVVVPLELEAEVIRLAKLSRLKYDQEREAAAKALGVRLTTLDNEVRAARRDDGRDGRAVKIDDPDPWETSVDGARLLSEIEHTIERHCALPEHAARAIALWVVLTYCTDHVAVLPLLLLRSPEKRCGKTTLLTLLSAMVRRGMSASNISPAGMYRVVEACSPTLLIDEADTFLRDARELRGIINSGHTHEAAYVIRVAEKDGDYIPMRYSTWGAKAISMIGDPPDTILDRSVLIPMRRRAPGERVERLRLDRLDKYADIPRRCMRWVADHGQALRQADPDMPGRLNDRAADNWRVLIGIAHEAGGDWPAMAHAAALALSSGTERDDASIGVKLLIDIHSTFARRKKDALSTKELLDELTADKEAPWATWNKGEPMSALQLASRLKEFGIRSKTIRVGKCTPKGYTRHQFDDAFRRYIPANSRVASDQSATPPHPINGADSNDSDAATSGEALRTEKPPSPCSGNGCGGVAGTAGGDGEVTPEYF